MFAASAEGTQREQGGPRAAALPARSPARARAAALPCADVGILPPPPAHCLAQLKHKDSRNTFSKPKGKDMTCTKEEAIAQMKELRRKIEVRAPARCPEKGKAFSGCRKRARAHRDRDPDSPGAYYYSDSSRRRTNARGANTLTLVANSGTLFKRQRPACNTRAAHLPRGRTASSSTRWPRRIATAAALRGAAPTPVTVRTVHSTLGNQESCIIQWCINCSSVFVSIG